MALLQPLTDLVQMLLLISELVTTQSRYLCYNLGKGVGSWEQLWQSQLWNIHIWVRLSTQPFDEEARNQDSSWGSKVFSDPRMTATASQRHNWGMLDTQCSAYSCATLSIHL